MTAFAYYRLPYLHHATKVVQDEGMPEVLASVGELNGKEGFVVAPFSPSAECPVVLIHPDRVKYIPIRKGQACPNDDSEEEQGRLARLLPRQEEQALYFEDFDQFHGLLEDGLLKKIVLSRCSKRRVRGEKPYSLSEPDSPFVQKLFLEACAKYPRLFVALVYTEQLGMWLMATPEILLRGEKADLTTISLAGTQKAQPSKMVADYPVEGVEWSEKNREEQQYVTDYIEQCVQSFTSDYSLVGPYTTMAAQLYHLRTDISFHLSDSQCLGDVLEALYPTPAVCGIPKKAAMDFILTHEHDARKYYSGFVGPINPLGHTDLFVSLRCVRIGDDGSLDIYAGGGLLRESEKLREWEETEAKMETIKSVLVSEE